MKNKSITTQSVFPYFQKNGLKINYKKGCQFFRPEDSPQGIYYLESGQAMLWAIDNIRTYNMTHYEPLPTFETPINCNF